ncbi:hypothetical protein HBA55_19410 [Pseudomaricurvus alkylphenolicus]|jgi:membrane-associated protease RseP (regulator of RpoE activity)|uniref:site-2 protease family protein n=1 Tax=Pseudomaricurvus alkylphenolicus TaxID=1306991 RepID=UPI001420354E|nr:site-2 protease family protein [Pseudomaricurvus alkylphenolicus]NIB41783.1 hypothetical protein [Pseudomaricurvus alkylphenolicus]
MNRVIFAVFSAMLLGGCAAATGVSKTVPESAHLVGSADLTAEQIQVFHQSSPPNKPYIPVANVAAHGNGYATEEVLVGTLKKEAAKVGAELVILTGSEITKDETVGSYGGGMYVASQIRRPHLYGVAAVYSKVSIGLRTENTGKIRYVASGSAAEKAGLKEGMTIVAINGIFYRGSVVMGTEVSMKDPGETVEIEVLTHENTKKKFFVTLESS